MDWRTEVFLATTCRTVQYELDKPRIRQLLIAFTANTDDFGVRLFPSADTPWPASGQLKYPGGYLMTFDVDMALDRKRCLLKVEGNNTAATARTLYLGIVTDEVDRPEFQIAEALLRLSDQIEGVEKVLKMLKPAHAEEV